MLGFTRHGLRPSLDLKIFTIKLLSYYKNCEFWKSLQNSPKSAKLAKSCQNLKTRQNLPKLANCMFSRKSAILGPKRATGGGGGWLLNCSYFALFSIVICDMGLFIDVSYAAILGWLLTAAQHKNQHPRHIDKCFPSFYRQCR
jgi:hypothetical protein